MSHLIKFDNTKTQLFSVILLIVRHLINRIIAITLLVSTSTLSSAQDLAITKLQCNGTYTNFGMQLQDVPLNGIYIEISGNRVRVFGAAGFDGTYAIVTRLEHGMGLQHEFNHSYGGFLNRFSGTLSLTEKGKIGSDGSYKLNQLLTAMCGKAKLLF